MYHASPIWLAVLLVAGCMDSESEKPAKSRKSGAEADSGTTLPDVMHAAENVLRGALSNNGAETEVVDFRALRDLLPDEVGGLERTSSEGEPSSLLGLRVSNAQAYYSNSEQSINVSVTDMGTLTAIGLGLADWLDVEIDRESDRGYERTRKFRSRGKNYPSYEKFENQGEYGSCEIQMSVAGRLIVAIEGTSIEPGLCDEVREELPLTQLEKLVREWSE